jgi:hypothetical protein
MTSTQHAPSCPSCGHAFLPGVTWPGANYCRGMALIRFIEAHPGSSGWELSQTIGMPYNDVLGGLSKLRQFGAVVTRTEPRESEGKWRWIPVSILSRP